MPGKRHHIREKLDLYDDEQIIADMKTLPNLREYARVILEPGRETATNSFHCAVLFYFRHYRPEITERMQAEAQAFCDAWPENYADMGALSSAGTYWHRAVRRRLRNLMRIKFRLSGRGTKARPWHCAGVDAWIGVVWPMVLKIHQERDLPFTPKAVEHTIYHRLYVPTRFYREEYMSKDEETGKVIFHGRYPLVRAFNKAWRALARQERDKAFRAMKDAQAEAIAAIRAAHKASEASQRGRKAAPAVPEPPTTPKKAPASPAKTTKRASGKVPAIKEVPSTPATERKAPAAKRKAPATKRIPAPEPGKSVKPPHAGKPAPKPDHSPRKAS